MVDVPIDNALTTPPEDIVATAILEDVHGVPPGVPDPDNVEPDPTHAVKVPEIVGVPTTLTVATALVDEGHKGFPVAELTV